MQSPSGTAAFGQYKPGESGSGFEPWAVEVVERAGDGVKEHTFFLDTERLFPSFGLLPRLFL